MYNTVWHEQYWGGLLTLPVIRGNNKGHLSQDDEGICVRFRFIELFSRTAKCV